MSSVWKGIKQFGKDSKDFITAVREDNPSSYKVSNELIRNRWGDREETHHEWAIRIRKRVNEQLPIKGDLFPSEYGRKGAYVVYVWYALKEIHKVEGSGKNQYEKVWNNCRTLCNMPNWKAYLNPKLGNVIKAGMNEEKHFLLIKKHYQIGYAILEEYINTKKLSGSELLLELTSLYNGF